MILYNKRLRFLYYPLFSVCMQTVPACQNLYKNSFTYHCLQDDKTLPFDNAIQFLGVFCFLVHDDFIFVCSLAVFRRLSVIVLSLELFPLVVVLFI